MAVKFPRDLVPFARQFRPFRSFVGILFQPEVIVFIGESSQFRAPKPFGPGLHISEHVVHRSDVDIVYSLAIIERKHGKLRYT